MIPRRNFITAVGGGSLLLGSASLAEEKTAAPASTPARITPAAEAKMVWALGVKVTIRADSEMTGGAYSAFEDLVLPGQGPPLHTHTNEDETMYVIEGELEVVLGDKTYTARPGDFAHWRAACRTASKTFRTSRRGCCSLHAGRVRKVVSRHRHSGHRRQRQAPAVTPEDIAKALKAAEGYGVVFAKKK